MRSDVTVAEVQPEQVDIVNAQRGFCSITALARASRAAEIYFVLSVMTTRIQPVADCAARNSEFSRDLAIIETQRAQLACGLDLLGRPCHDLGLVREVGFEPTRLAAIGFEPMLSANSNTPACPMRSIPVVGRRLNIAPSQ